tara:strand:+ start:1970 stop:2899 length:930 start_codon:yes stop_codon:yes gene_type:complete
MADFTLKQLRYFEALARHLHFGNAADVCAISQPALSMQIKDLESMIGAALFERSARQVRLTSFGADFALRAREILLAADELGDLARASGGMMTGRLRLGIIPTVAPYLLPTLIGNLQASYPGADLHIRETLTPRLIEEVSDGKLDAAIVALPIDEPSFEEVALFTEDFVLVRPLIDANKPVPARETLRDMRLLLLEEGHCFRDQALSFCNVATLRPWDGLDGSSLSTLVQMVGANMGITLLPEMAIAVEARAAPVAISRFEGSPPSRTIGMIWRKSNPLSKRFAQVAKVVKGSGQQIRKPATETCLTAV